MKYLYLIAIILLNYSCKTDPKETTTLSPPKDHTIMTVTPEQRDALVAELKTRFEKDQKALSNLINSPQDSRKQLEAIKKSVVADNTKRMKELFEKYGFLGWDLVGEEGSHHFWLMVQHSDEDTDFQYAVLKKMGPAVEKNNAFAPNYAYLTDRVRLNTNKKQIYGTQVTYKDNGQAIPKPLVDSLNVNTRRNDIAMKPIELYLNSMTKKNWRLNKDIYMENGFEEMTLHKE